MEEKYSSAVAVTEVAEKSEKGTRVINDFIVPYVPGNTFSPGSTDVGDVSWLTPTAQIHVAAFPNAAPGHSWQNVSIGRTSIAHKAVLHAGKVMAAATIDLLEKPELEILALSYEAGVFGVKSSNNRHFFIFAHTEYDDDTLAQEYFRDVKRGLSPAVPAPLLPRRQPQPHPHRQLAQRGPVILHQLAELLRLSDHTL